MENPRETHDRKLDEKKEINIVLLSTFEIPINAINVNSCKIKVDTVLRLVSWMDHMIEKSALKCLVKVLYICFCVILYEIFLNVE